MLALFLIAMPECLTKKLLKGGRAYSGLQLEVMHPVMEGKA